MDKNNADIPAKKPSFFEVFKAQCSKSDLGPISLNWFEELTSEAPSYDMKKTEDLVHKTMDHTAFKTPKGKLCINTPSVSTPLIFKDQNKHLMMFASSVEELAQFNAETGKTFSEMQRMRTQMDQSNEGMTLSIACLFTSPVLQGMQSNKYALNESLLHTPKIFEVQTQKCITESLGAEADPDMSWSSSLATPPTLSPTVIIDRVNDSVSGTKQHNERIDTIMCNIFSKYGESLKNNNMKSSRIEIPYAGIDSKIHNFERFLNGTFGKNTLPNQLGGHRKPSNIAKVEDNNDEAYSNFSLCITNSRSFCAKVNSVEQNKNTVFYEMNHDELAEESEMNKDYKDESVPKCERELNSSKYRLKKNIPQNAVHREEDMPLSLLCPWSQLDFSGLEITQLENESLKGICSTPTLHVKKTFQSNLPSIEKECTSPKILNPTSLVQDNNMSSPENSSIPDNSPVSGSIKKDSILLEHFEDVQSTFPNFSGSNSFLMDSRALTDISEDPRSCFDFTRKNDKTASDCPPGHIPNLTSSDGRQHTRSGLKNMSSLSSLKKRPKKFIYSLNKSVICQEERTTKKDGSLTGFMPVYTNLKPCITEPSENPIGNEGQIGRNANNHTRKEKQQIESEEYCTPFKMFNETPSNDRTNVESNVLDNSSLLLQTKVKKEAVMFSSHTGANHQKEISENGVHEFSHSNTSDRQNSRKCSQFTNYNSVQEDLEDYILPMQISETENKPAAMELTAQCLNSGTQMADPGYHSVKTSESKIIVLEDEIDTKQHLSLNVTEDKNNSKQRLLGHSCQNKIQNFKGFRTASNKQIVLSDDNIRKGKLLFRDIDDQHLKDFQSEGIRAISDQNKQGDIEIFAARENEINKDLCNFLHVSDSVVNIHSDDTKIGLHECGIKSLKNLFTSRHPEEKQNLTASQAAEITELSNILEETDSQFEFTQFRKYQTVMYNNTSESGCFGHNDINSNTWKDTGFVNNFGKKHPRDDDNQSSYKHKDTEEYKMNSQNNEEIILLKSRRKEKKCFAPLTSAPLQSDLENCSSVENKDEITVQAAELVSDMNGMDEIFNSPKIKSDGSKTCNNWNVCMKEIDTDWPQRDKKANAGFIMQGNTKDAVAFVEEDIENYTKVVNCSKSSVVQITSTTEFNLKVVKKYSINITGNELSSIKNQSVLTTHQVVHCGETQCNCPETLSDLTCLTEVAKIEKNTTLKDADEKENFISEQEKKINNPENVYLLQSVHTVAERNMPAKKSERLDLLLGSNIQEEASNVSYSKGKTGTKHKEGIISVKKCTELNQNEFLLGCNLKNVPGSRERQTSGFHTASGKQITVTEKSLFKARHLFSEEENLETVDNDSSLTKPKNTVTNNVNITNIEIGEGAGKCRAVCSNDNFACSLDKLPNTAKETEKPETIERMPLDINISESDFTAENNLIVSGKICKNENWMREKCDLLLLDSNTKYSDSEKKASKQLKARPVAFSFNTASGKTVGVSQEALKNVQQFFHKNCSDLASHSEMNKSLSDAFGNSNCINASYLNVKEIPVEYSDVYQFPTTEEFCETEQTLQHAEPMSLDTVSKPNCEPSDDHFQMDKCSDTWTSNVNCKSDFFSNTSGFFSTASGKPVQLSKESLKKARVLFSEIENDSSEHQTIAPDSSYSKNKTHSGKNKASTENRPLIFQRGKMKMSKNSLNNKIPMCMTHEKSKKETEFKKSFSCLKDVIEPSKITQSYESRVNTKYTTEGNLDSLCSVYSQTPDNYLEVETSESARAFMEDDDLTDSEIQTKIQKSILSSEKANTFLSHTGTGKKHVQKGNLFEGLPIKRKLLPEFDQSETFSRSSFKSSTSSPYGTMNDRKMFFNNISLKPAVCDPFSSTRERQEILNLNLSAPSQVLRGSKCDQFQKCFPKQSLCRSLAQFGKTITERSKVEQNYHSAKKPTKVFVPPFKIKSGVLEGEIGNVKELSSFSNKNISRTEEFNATEVIRSLTESEKDKFAKVSVMDSECSKTIQDLTEIITFLHYARNLQEMRIKMKQDQRIHPQPGSLYLVKMSSGLCRIPLKIAVEEKLPGSYSSDQLYAFGVSRQCIRLNSTNAEDFEFLMQDCFSRKYFLENHGIQLADGGYVIPSDEGRAGKEQFYRALCDTPGVDPSLISKAWVYNHYKWIVWKLAAMEVAFPQAFASKCLTPERVLLQLKYRYDIEVDKGQRSAIKRITERDDVAGKTIILCISKIISFSTNIPHIASNKNTTEDRKKEMAVVEVTDGWYGIRAVLDPPLQSLLRRQKLTVGQKIFVHGAELVGSHDASTPLEAPESLMLKISANSTRRARWYAKLGYYQDPRPFPLRLSSLFNDGGSVVCIDVIVQRIYPIQWMEKLSTGSYVFRNCRAEEREAAKHAENRQKTLEALLAKIQAEFEKNEDESKRILRSHTLTRQQIHCLQDGAELYEAVINSADPSYMEGFFSEEQLKALNSHRQMVNDKKQAQKEAEFRKAVESAEQEENSLRRDVSSLIKLRIVDYRTENSRKDVILNIWCPSPHVCTLLKEGGRYRIIQLCASHSRGKLETANLQLTASKKTQYQELPVSQEFLSQVYRPRECLVYSKLLEPSFQPACSEVDLVGYIVYLKERTDVDFSTLVYLSDKHHNIIALQICTDLKQLAIEDVMVPSALISITNLQWRPQFRSDIPTLFAGELSAFSSNPKENHLQESFEELRTTVKNDSCFCKDAQCKLMSLLKANCLQVYNLSKECGSDHFVSPWKSDAGDEQPIITPNGELRHASPLTVVKSDSKPFVSLGSAKVTPNLQETPKNYKKRKAMDLLSQVPPPPPVKPICTFVSPALKRAFQPPRSFCTQNETSLKRKEIKVKKLPTEKLNGSGFSPVNNFVADEELAMINTQALLSNFPEERG